MGTWYVKVRRYDGRAETVKACTSQAEAATWVNKFNAERDDTPYFWEGRG